MLSKSTEVESKMSWPFYGVENNFGVLNRFGHRADLVKRGSHGDKAGAGNGTIRRIQPDRSAKSRRLPDRTRLCPNPERPNSRPSPPPRRCRRKIRRRLAINHEDFCRSISRVFGGSAHGKFVHISPAQENKRPQI